MTLPHDPIAARECVRCGAPRGQRVVRRASDRLKWSLDTALHFDFPETWRRPRKVVLGQDGFCGTCRAELVREAAR